MDRVKELFCKWKEQITDEYAKSELNRIENDLNEQYECFYKDLSFGTGGLRGVIGVGTNRMNRYTITKATIGLAKYLCSKYGIDAQKSGVIIGYDSRKFSYEFAKVSALVLNQYGIKSYLFKSITPTPVVSFGVNQLSCKAGIVITASHNPKKYNGYKVYNHEGCQITDVAARSISELISKSDPFESMKLDETNELYHEIDREVNDAFIEKVLSHSSNLDSGVKKDLKVVYTPIHGSGNIPVRTVLTKAGFHLDLVEEQLTPDSDFPTVSTPNPEEREALQLAIEKAKSIDADILFGTDPDCDRIGVGVKQGTEYRLLSGNQLGALLADYIITKKREEDAIPQNAVIMKTIVTNELGTEIAKANGIKSMETLTGFKYIGEKITEFDKSHKYNYLFGYEESFGYLIGAYANDKDAVGAALTLCEMAAEYKVQNITLIDRLEMLYKKYGYYLDHLDSITLEGESGLAKIGEMMIGIREQKGDFLGETLNIEDYKEGIKGLPKSNVIKIFLKDGSWVAVRPSGTEPKIKVYYSVKAKNEQRAKSRLEELRSNIKKAVNI